MMSERAMVGRVRRELKECFTLLHKLFGFDFAIPRLCVGNKHMSEFMQITTRREMEHSFLVEIIYDEEANAIFVPDGLISKRYIHETNEECRARRMYRLLWALALCHICRTNLSLGDKEIEELFEKISRSSKRGSKKHKSNDERACVLRAFRDGLARKIAMSACIESEDDALREIGEKEHRRLTSNFQEFVDSDNTKLMAKVYGFDLEEIPEEAPYNPRQDDEEKVRNYWDRYRVSDWRPVLLKYFLTNLSALNPAYHGSLVGYFFVNALWDTVKDHLNVLVKNPPVTVSHILHPFQYAKEVEIAIV